MGLFSEWLSKRLVESDVRNPGEVTSLGGSPLSSGLEKLTRGLRSGKLDRGYTDFGIIAQVFGLSEEEIQELMKFKVVINRGKDIDVKKLQNLQRQLNPGQSSRVDYGTVHPLPKID